SSGSAKEPVFILAGQQGFALGEHGVAGADVKHFFSEWLQIPCLIRRQSGDVGRRSAGLTHYRDWQASLANWLVRAGAASGAADCRDVRLPNPLWGPGRDRLVVRRDHQWAVRTAQWMLVSSDADQCDEAASSAHRDAAEPNATREAPQLFVKPDDRWEINEIASRCPDVVQELLAELEADESADCAAS
ncbi:MAG: hypothetical protein KDA61_22985, partial [Planctomycetales bacterium]|nr:hypothetical protein [Planctomycetales bacterium]